MYNKFQPSVGIYIPVPWILYVLSYREYIYIIYNIYIYMCYVDEKLSPSYMGIFSPRDFRIPPGTKRTLTITHDASMVHGIFTDP